MSDPVEEAARAALAGELIVIPTDTVYGIGTRPDDPAVTARLFRAKDRTRDLELPVLASSGASAREIAAFDVRAELLARELWPGPLTLVLPRTDRSRPWDLGGDPETIGVRVPRHPLALAVLSRSGPLAVTSANRSGGVTPGTCEELEAIFGKAVSIYLCDERPPPGTPSTVVDLAHGEHAVLRAGGASDATIREVLGLGAPEA